MRYKEGLFFLVLVALLVVVYIFWGKNDDEEIKRNKAMIEKVDSIIDSLKNNMAEENKKLLGRIDSIKVINTNKTFIRNNYIGISNEVDNINDRDSVANYLRDWLNKLQSPNFE